MSITSSRPRPEGRAPEPWLTTEEIAKYLRKPVSWIHQNADRHGIPRRRLGNQYRYRISEVDQWLLRDPA